MSSTTEARGRSLPLAAFGAGALVALSAGVFGTVHPPSTSGTTALGFDTVLEMKVVVSTVIGVLAVLQVLGALVMYGRLGIPAPSWLAAAHRTGGRIAVILSVFVAYHCLWTLGLQTGIVAGGGAVPLRTVVHGVAGCAVVGALVVKVTAVRSRRSPGWFLPLAGGLLFALLVVVLLTSVVWYLAANGWPSPGGYR